MEPVLLLGEIVARNPGAMKLPQRRFCRSEIGRVAIGLGDMQRHAIDPAADEKSLARKQKRWCDIERAGNLKHPAFTPEQLFRQRPSPPRYGIEPA